MHRPALLHHRKSHTRSDVRDVNGNSPQPGSKTCDRLVRTIVITASDAGYFGFASEMLRSVKALKEEDVSLGFIDLGLGTAERRWLDEQSVLVAAPHSELDLTALKSKPTLQKMGYLARPFLREAFPGYDLYAWIDADAWLQERSGLDTLLASAKRDGAALVRENERSYRFSRWLLGWKAKHFVLGYGMLHGAYLWTRPHINNGVFAMRADAPHWAAWQRRYQKAIRRTGIPAPHDQFGLNAAVYVDRLGASFLPPTCNWICDLATPMWDEAAGAFCVPYPPYTPISIMHLAGPAKTATYDIRTSGGRIIRGSLRFGAERTFVT
jgi:hypothetical protein